MPFREESCRSSCVYSGPLHSYNRDAVSQHPSTRAGAESIQLIYSGRALQALSDLARQFQCHPIFWREFLDSDVVKVKGEDPGTQGPLKRNDPGTVTILQYRFN